MVFRRTVAAAVILALANYFTGCHYKARIEQKQISEAGKIVEVVLVNGDVVKFDDDGGFYNSEKRLVYGHTKKHEYVEIIIDDISYARVSKANVAGTVFLTVGILALALVAALAIAMATKDSCPFVYSFDGSKYVFDAEPYGGAVCQGLQKTDYSRLEHLVPVAGKYRLQMRNEVEETQFTDEMKLLVVDHAENSEIIPDMLGNLHLVMNPVAPSASYDEEGKSLQKFVYQRDDVAWQSTMPKDSVIPKNLRHRLIFEFPKPPQAKTAKLLVNLGTGLWGSGMIKEMLQLRGDRVDAWYADVNRGGEKLMELYQFNEREELYFLKLYIQEADGWAQQGFLFGGGPFITEDRCIPIDLSRVPGDTVKIRLNPPKGFWSIDHLAIEYGDYPFPEVKEVPIASAQDQPGKDVSELLRATDHRYQVLPDVGDWVKLDFDVPDQTPGTKRSIFLKTSGYYDIHLPKDQPEQTALIRQLITKPGMIAEWAMERFFNWRTSLAGSN